MDSEQGVDQFRRQAGMTRFRIDLQPLRPGRRRTAMLGIGWLATMAVLVLALVPRTALRAQQPEDPRRIALNEYQATPPFLVRLDVDRPDRVYRAGDTIQVSVRSERAGFLYLFYCDANRSVSCLFPNQVRQDNRIAANETLIVPDQSARFRLRVGAPFGQEILKAVVTTQPLESLEIQALTKGNLTAIESRRFKGVFVELREDSSGAETPSTAPERGWSEHDLELMTVASAAEPPARSSLAEISRRGNGIGEVVSPGTSPGSPAATPPNPTPATDQAAGRVGVFIGISKYLAPQIRPLTTAARDARAMAEAMQSRGRLSDAVVLVDEQATLDNIRRLIQEGLPAATRPGDVIILYWSGHGGRVSNVDGNEPDGFDEYLVPYDGQLEPSDATRKTMLLDKSFGRWVQHLDGRKLIVILDACHSGGQTQGARKALSGGADDVPFRDFFFHTTLRRIKDIGQRETAVLASSRATQLSFERRDGSLSVMTHFLVQRLKAGSTSLSLPDVARYIIDEVPKFVEENYAGTTQTPVFVDNTTPPVYLRP